MTRMKSWESPRRGRRRNNKSKAATARLRQLKKRNQQLRNKLRSAADHAPSHSRHNPPKSPPSPDLEGILLNAIAA